MRRTDRFPLTGGPKKFDPQRKKLLFRSGDVRILFIVESSHMETNNSITFRGRTHVIGFAEEPQATVNFTPKGQHGWIEYP